ncbi:MAG: NADH-quinone oxidoreductase subunit L, partial [Actinobacteria bacterium]|nr:NADH-quinone oxidoreductase subunit L [Actinomycetota bacterium]
LAVRMIADNFFLLLVSWEIMGLCSYLLIGHWYEKKEPQEASMKAFLTTRVGDVGLMVGIWILFAATGTFKFNEIAELAQAGEIAPAVILTAAI